MAPFSFAMPVTTFKGESLPVYVLQRVTRPSKCPATTAVSAVASAENGQGPCPQKLGPPHVLPTTTAIVTANPRPQRAMPSPHQRRGVSQRPSLAEQLQTISNGAQSITTQLRTQYNLHTRSRPVSTRAQSSTFGYAFSANDTLLEATTVQLSVGRLDCRFPCPVQFASDRCMYLFQHPFEAKEIQMIMYYRDMRHVQLHLQDRALRFRVERALDQFGDDYRPSNPQHFLRIVFATVSEAERVKQFLAKHKRTFSSNANE